MAESSVDLGSVLDSMVANGIATPEDAEMARKNLDDPEVCAMIGFMGLLLAGQGGTLELASDDRTESISAEPVLRGNPDSPVIITASSTDGMFSPETAGFIAEQAFSENIFPEDLV